MDENKNVENNGGTQTQDGMSYSFDFANQVDNSVKPVTPEVAANSDSGQPSVQEATVNVEIPVQPTVNAETPIQPSAQEATVNVETPVQPSVQEATVNVETPVQPSAQEATVNVETPVQPTVNAETPVQATNQTQPTVTPSPETNVSSVTPDNSVNQISTSNVGVNTSATNDAVQTDENPIMPGVAPTIPVTPETVAVKEGEDESLIKDKKATKKFLIMLFVLIFAFIIALPFIFNFLG